jgi:hypothetical protein
MDDLPERQGVIMRREVMHHASSSIDCISSIRHSDDTATMGAHMKIARQLRGECNNGLDCPKVYELTDGRFAVQGEPANPSLLVEAGVPDHETMVVVPRWLLPEL